MEVIFFNFRNKKVLWEMLEEFERFANISVLAVVSECLVESSQLTPTPYQDTFSEVPTTSDMFSK